MIETVETDFARRLRDVQRAGRLRIRLYCAIVAANESARLCLHDLRQPERAERYLRAADFYAALYDKMLRLQARARGEASDGE